MLSRRNAAYVCRVYARNSSGRNQCRPPAAGQAGLAQAWSGPRFCTPRSAPLAGSLSAKFPTT
eukprot:365747-Chlamydomonas_euryale.AAC.65